VSGQEPSSFGRTGHLCADHRRWEIANRNNIFTPVGLKRFAFLANSDFHKPKHIYSWKTLLHCEKDREAMKDCIRRNEHVSFTLYRDGMTGETMRSPALRLRRGFS